MKDKDVLLPDTRHSYSLLYQSNKLPAFPNYFSPGEDLVRELVLTIKMGACLTTAFNI